MSPDGDGPRPRSDADAGPDADRAADRPVRRGTVDLRTASGELIHHDEAFVRYDRDAFVVSTDPSFPPDAIETYEKDAVAWIEVRHPRR
ncbi:hypothetical protein [Salinigranum marinum]|uniref:hypothetical protein n=1 Tax=Salinigranum marinum TaxID=1515595 RepID=UPI002989E3C6|nr:hypothetical protein [Salinigranum marinum]